MCICSFLVWKNACLNYREFDLEGDLVGVPHTWCLSAQSFITRLKLIWGEYDIVAMNEWKKKCVSLHRTWVSKRTVHQLIDMVATHDFYPMDPTIWMTIVAFGCVVVKWNVIFFNLLFFSCKTFKISKNEWLKWIK